MRTTLIGSGNVATHLAKILTIKGFFIGEIFSKNIENAKILAEELKIFEKKDKNTQKKHSHTNVTDSLDFSESESKLFILAVKDDFLAEVVAKLKLPRNSFVMHTSGSMPLELLMPFTEKSIGIGVFYPLQTFSKTNSLTSKDGINANLDSKKIKKNIIDFWENVPICVEGDGEYVSDVFYFIAKKITSKIYQINSEQRQILHLGATFACNFSNYMYHIAKEILQKSNLPFEMLENLVKETANKAFLMPPLDAQTGVARRGDMNIIALHQQKLAENPEIKELYSQITKQILELYHK